MKAEKNSRQEIFSAYLWLMSEKISRLVFGIWASTAVARSLGPDQYGVLTSALTIFGILQTVALMGLDAVILRRASQHASSVPRYLGTALAIKLLVAGVTVAGLFSIWSLFGTESIGTLALLCALSVALLFQPLDTYDQLNQATGNSRRTAISRTFTHATSSTLKYIAASNGAPALIIVIAYTFEYALGSILCYFSRAYRTKPTKPDIRVTRILFRESIPHLLTALAVVIYMRIDQYFVLARFGPEMLGKYAAANMLASVGYLLPTVLASALTPHVNRRALAGEKALDQVMRRVFRAYFALAVALSTTIFLAAPHLERLLFGEKFSGVANLLQAMSFANIPIFLGVAQGLWINATRNGALAVKKTLIGVSASLITNYLLPVDFGVQGVIWATTFAQLMATVLSNIFFAPRIFKMQMDSILFWRQDAPN